MAFASVCDAFKYKNVAEKTVPHRSTDKHVLYDKQALSHIDKKNEPRILMIDDWGFGHIFKEKMLLATFPREKTLTNLNH